MERKIKLIPHRVYKYCPKCTGTMEHCSVMTCTAVNLAVVHTSTNMMFPMTELVNHRCKLCGHGENYDKQYPYIDYIEDGDLG